MPSSGTGREVKADNSFDFYSNIAAGQRCKHSVVVEMKGKTRILKGLTVF